MEPPFLFLIPFLFSFHAVITNSMAANTIALNQTIRDGQTIVSPQQTFELGFFSPTITSHNRYLGIWYKRLATGTVAWVANRQTPIATKTGELTLHADGVLVLRDSTTNTIIWSSSISTTAATPNPFAQLLDNGNLMVVDHEGGIDGPDDYIWQSFDHPGNTYLPGMKFGRNLQKGVVTNFTSWKTDDDPSEGDHMVYMDFNGVPQVYQKKGDMIQMRLGSWNGLSFTGMPILKPDSVFKFKQVSNQKEIYYIFELFKSSNLIKIMLNPAGDFVRLNWNNRTKEWSLFSTPELEDKCSKYMLCGPYASCNTDQFPVCECLKGFVPKSPRQWDAGDWTSGCQRKIPLDCGVGEGFQPYSSMKLPDTRRSWFDRKMNLEQCRVKCINECNCSAYSSLDIRVNTGCMLWYDELVDIRSFSNIGQDIYIRTEKRKKGLSKKKKAMVIGIPVTAGTVGLAVLIGLRVLTMMRTSNFKPQGGRHDPTTKDKQESQIYGPQKQNPHDPSLLLDANNSFSNKKDEDEEGGSEPVNKTRRVNRDKGRVSSKASSNTVECGDPRADETNDYDATTFKNEPDQIQQDDDEVVDPSSESESRTTCRNCLRKMPRHPIRRPKNPTDPPVSHHLNAVDMELKEETYVDLDPSTILPDDPEQPRFATTGPPGASSSVTSYAAHDEMRRVNKVMGRGSSKNNNKIVGRGDPRVDETNDYEDDTFTNELDQIQQEDNAVVGPSSESELRTRCHKCLRKTLRHPSQRPETPKDPPVSHHPNMADMELKEETYVDLESSTIPPDDPELWERSDEGQPRFTTTSPPGASSSVTSYAAHDDMRRVNRVKGRGSSKDSNNIVVRDDPRADETKDYKDDTFTNELDQIQQEHDVVIGPFSGSESRTRCRNALRKTPKHPSQRPEMPKDPLVSHHPNAADMELKEDTYVDFDPSTIPPDDPKLWERSDEGQPRNATTGPPGTTSSVTSHAAHDEMRPVNKGKGKGSSKDSSNIVERDDPRADETNYYEDATFNNAQDQIQQEDDTVVGPFSRSESRTRCRNTLMKTPRHLSQRPETPMDPLVSHHPNAADMELKEETYGDLDPSTIPPDDPELWERSDEKQPRFATTGPSGANSSVTSYAVHDEMTHVNRGKGRGSSKDNSIIVGHGDPRVDETSDYADSTFTNELDRIQKEDDAVVGPFSGSESRTRCHNTFRKTPRHLSRRPETPMDPPASHHPNAADMELKEETYDDLDPSTIPPDDPELWECSNEGQPRFAKTSPPGTSFSVSSYAADDEMRPVNRGKGKGSSKDSSNIVERDDPRADETNYYEDATFNNAQDQIQQEDDAVVGPFSGSESRTRCRNALRKTPKNPSQRPEMPKDPLVSHHPNAADMELKEDTYVDFDPSTIPPDDPKLWERSDEGQPRNATTGPPGTTSSVTSHAAHDEMRPVNRCKGKCSSKDSSNIVERDDPRADETNYYEDATFNNVQDQIQQEDDAVVGPFSRSKSMTRCRNSLMKTPRHLSQRPETPMDPLVSHHPNAADMELKEATYGDLDPSTIPPDDPELWERSDEEQPRFATTGPPDANSSVTSYAAHDEMRRISRGMGRGFSKDSSNIVRRGDPHADETNDYEDATFTNKLDQIQQEDDAIVGPFSGSESRTRCRNTLRKTPKHPSQRPETPMDPPVYHYSKATGMPLIKETYVDLDLSTILTDDQELWERSDEGQPRFATTDLLGANSNVTSYGAYDEKRRLNKGKGRGSSEASSNTIGHGDTRTDATNDYDVAIFTNESDLIQLEDDAVVVLSSGSESKTRCRNTLRKTPRHLSQRLETPTYPPIYHYPKATDMMLKEETNVDLDPSTIPLDDPESLERSDEGQPRFAKTGHPGASSSVTSYGAHDEVYALKEKLMTYEERLKEEQRKRAELESVQKKQVEELARQKELAVKFEAFMAQYNGKNPPSPPS